ncbi:MAG: GNAT family N-acetyltransferase [Promethearchaeota archaeon]|nr:MAG: GNAT family N-acetyltransferase [Candidatus Lokiarchaeota archaeon]
MIILRRAKKEDLKFLYKLREATLKKYIDQIGHWDEEWQRNNIIKPSNLKRTLIIIKFGQEVGNISIFKRRKSLSLVRIEILPKFQCQGIGTNILNRLISLSTKIKTPLFLQVLKLNKNAQKFYYRLGFIKIGENDTHLKLKFNKY